MSHTYCYFSRNISINPKSRTRFNLLKKIACYGLLVVFLELDSGRVINIVTKKNFFSFLFVFAMVFVLSLVKTKSKIIIDNVCFTVFVTVFA